ncbi:hypothetical protein [Methylobacterium sp. E-066]|uniref:hypothetical protein n=1 Tax=Methylobacterium sp. E-066 TaxID=2836584 RepID=UPI001FB8A142|nr:hypothetical protein [Methylobacterium sp. E-066]MCJ2141012.1 hypothetical protein [Methylobacterium sp. E-066]
MNRDLVLWSVRSGNIKSSGDYIEDFKKLLSLDTIKYAFSAEGINYAKDIRTTYREIIPGNYIINHITCQFGREITEVSAEEWSFLTGRDDLPIPGDNYISIGNGQIVDSGFIDVVSTDGRYLRRSGQVRLVSSEAPQSFRTVVANDLPDLSKKIIYSRFSAYLE